MYKELVISASDHETRVALLEDKTIAELFIERGEYSNITGNIYKGRVQRVLPGMQAAFVDIGLNQAAFIYVGDVIENSFGDLEKIFKKEDDPEETDEEDEDGDNGKLEFDFSSRNYHIEDLISDGQEVLVQVAKSPIGSKGARITSHISIPGHFLVLMPTVDHIGVSRRIEDEAERIRLKNGIISLRKESCGYIIRTAAEGISIDRLQKEIVFLNNIWKTVQKKYKEATTPYLLHQELNLTLRAVRDVLAHEANKLIIDSKQNHRSILNFVDEFMPSLKGSVALYQGTEPIFDAYNLEGDISRALQKKVWLKSGGYIIIEHTEALVAIDVNTGRYVGKHNFEETILKTNLEAVKEIAYQIRLRNLGGLIIIDFIDMERK